MPYIKEEDRKRLDSPLPTILSEGELNYLVTKLCLAYVAQHGKSYATVNAVVGALEGAKLEFYRRYAAPYEDEKIYVNGDVY